MNSELEDFINDEILKQNDLLNLSAEKRKKISIGIVHLLSYEMKCFNFSILKKSFEKIGMIGENPLERTLSCCSAFQSIPSNQIKLIKSSMSELCEIFRQHGEFEK